jgi:hypothetical protein
MKAYVGAMPMVGSLTRARWQCECQGSQGAARSAAAHTARPATGGHPRHRGYAHRPAGGRVRPPYLKTKNVHWHVSGPHFHDYRLLVDKQSGKLFAMTVPIAERVRRVRSTTLRAIGYIGHLQHTRDNDADYVTPLDMQAELREGTVSVTSTGMLQPRSSWRPGSTRPSSGSGFCLRRAALNRSRTALSGTVGRCPTGGVGLGAGGRPPCPRAFANLGHSR